MEKLNRLGKKDYLVHDNHTGTAFKGLRPLVPGFLFHKSDHKKTVNNSIEVCYEYTYEKRLVRKLMSW